jgi:adenylate kinase
MESYSRDQLQKLFSDEKERIKQEYISRIVDYIYRSVISTAKSNNTVKEYICKDDQFRSITTIPLIEISSQVIEKLNALFPDCSIKFVQESIPSEIFQDRKRPQTHPRSAIIIDWS